jgi:hypothetical protein
MRPHRVASVSICVLALLGLSHTQLPPAAHSAGAKTWVGHYEDVENYLRTAECVGMENFPIGTSSQNSAPMAKRCVLRPGGPVARMLWKPLAPAVFRGFMESPEGNLAAYALDRLLRMDMLPPVVERDLLGHKGAATFWVENVTIPTSDKSPAAAEQAYWDLQIVRMTMFDNLIGNTARTFNNMLRDGAGNLILLDHSRAFGTSTELPQPMPRVDREFWASIDAMTRKQLDSALSRWLNAEEIEAVVGRRDRMRAEIKKQIGQRAP